METGGPPAPRYSAPAVASRPIIVSISGRPAATSEPNAISMIVSVTGQEITSDFNIAERFAALKSDHIPAAPVRCTCTAPLDSAASLPLRRAGKAPVAL